MWIPVIAVLALIAVIANEGIEVNHDQKIRIKIGGRKIRFRKIFKRRKK